MGSAEAACCIAVLGQVAHRSTAIKLDHGPVGRTRACSRALQSAWGKELTELRVHLAANAEWTHTLDMSMRALC